MRDVKTVYILSPHLDDAVLSLGEHIISWKKQGKKVVVITVFTNFKIKGFIPKYSQNYVKKSGFKSVKDFEKSRINEDIKVMNEMGLEYEHWNFVDAGFRGVYKTTEELLGGEINTIDNKLVIQIINKIKNISADLILLPYGVGGHVDHVILKMAGGVLNGNVLYYLESPYLWDHFNYFKYLFKIIKRKSIIFKTKSKLDLLKMYVSQYNLLIKNRKNFYEVIVGL